MGARLLAEPHPAQLFPTFVLTSLSTTRRRCAITLFAPIIFFYKPMAIPALHRFLGLPFQQHPATTTSSTPSQQLIYHPPPTSAFISWFYHHSYNTKFHHNTQLPNRLGP
ncbi:hypothetical protein LX32DRAFT_228152 [Colletotrichum zoysiae]|uniref:Uncharacterized protein n=1 Tax=Colletotrichum zoysiae TaxID=1216348 RepID=A0AAD9M502_9PEZI|nr:hypothetical protein LX32DRAFT_228152 [Colletotrichum zoysiae]